MIDFTPQQIVEVLNGVGIAHCITDDEVLAERRKILSKYEELKSTPIWFPNRGPRGEASGPGAMLLPGFEHASIEARAWWLEENVLK